MARLLDDNPNLASGAAFDARALTVDGVRWTHTAAKFWAALLQEVEADYPQCHTLLFETLSGAELTRDLLFPEQALQRALDRSPPFADLRQALREALADLELYGLPGSVRLTLLGGRPSGAGARPETALLRRDLPLDCVDADIFAYLAVWLLEWAGLPESRWKDPVLEGACAARPAPGRPALRLRFRFERRHLSEDLYRWRLRLAFRPLGIPDDPVPPAPHPNATEEPS